ncbi:MAG: hypothetical protein RPS47_16800 [Colwellia sp.]
MKYLYIPLLLVISVVLFFLATSETEYSNEGVQFCKKAISTSQPYGLNSIITDPEITNNSHEKITFDWKDLLVTGKDGKRSISIGRCIYHKIDNEIVFLSIYGDNLISNNNDVINLLSKSSSKKSRAIAKEIGLNERQIAWIKRNGSRSFYGQYNPGNKIIGFLEIYEDDLIKLDKLNVINLYPDINNKDQFQSIETNLSSVLSKSL